MRKTEQARQSKWKDDEPGRLAVEMPGPPVGDDGEAERPHPRLRPQVRHNRIVVAAADTNQKTQSGSGFQLIKYPSFSSNERTNHLEDDTYPSIRVSLITCTPAHGNH